MLLLWASTRLQNGQIARLDAEPAGRKERHYGSIHGAHIRCFLRCVLGNTRLHHPPLRHEVLVDRKETLNVLGSPYPIPCRLDGDRLQHRAHPHGKLVDRKEGGRTMFNRICPDVLFEYAMAFLFCGIVGLLVYLLLTYSR